MVDFVKKVEKLVSSMGINHVVAEAIGTKIVGILSITQSENVGGWMEPNNIDGWLFIEANAISN